MKPLDQCWSVSEAVGLATILEASAPKLGNVHPAASFADMHFGHFVASATAVSTVFRDVHTLTLGQLVLDSVKATRLRAGCNTNLGTILLLAPLAKAACMPAGKIDRRSLHHAVTEVLQGLSSDDSRLIYEAIRWAQPGGLGDQSSNDIAQEAPARLLDAMEQVAEIDLVAKQYATGFNDLFQLFLPWLEDALLKHSCTLKAILHLQLQIMVWQPDSLIARKCGLNRAQQVQAMAREARKAMESDEVDSRQHLMQFDSFLRSDGNKLNPGTTADLVAATLFCRLVES